MSVAIRCEHLSKCYHIYDSPQDRLKQSVIPRLQRALSLPQRTYYREFWALRGISFEIAKGETVGIIGRNGSGKSTLLQLLCGTLTPTSGTVETADRVAALLELGSGFNPEFSGRENVFMNAAVLGLPPEKTLERLDDILAFADIGEYIDQPVKSYSSGMTVRLAFAVMAHVDADLLVIDEALSVGDVFFVQKCMRFLRSFMERGTILFVSHDTGSVLSLCQRAIWLEKGGIEAMGTPKEVVAKYTQRFYEAQQGASAHVKEVTRAIDREELAPRDMRQDFLNASSLRNDIETFTFNPAAAAFGARGASIASVQLLDSEGTPLSWVVGGEMVALQVVCDVHEAIYNPIVGFLVNDRQGQPLFGDNTFLTTLCSPLLATPGQPLEAIFEFRMPILPMGDYTVTVAIASGTQAEHVQHHWIHDAMAFRSHSTSACTGLVGIPMTRIELK